MELYRKKIDEKDFRKFLKREYPEDKPEKGFFKMWLDGQGYDYGNSDEYIVDGPGDGGFDAFAWPPRGRSDLNIQVIQSKYYRGKVLPSALKSFIRAVEIFRSGSTADFETWLKTVRASLKSHYRSLWRDRKEINFVLVTSGAIDRISERQLRRLDVQIEKKEHIHALFRDQLRGKTPRPDSIFFRIKQRPQKMGSNDGHNLYVFPAKLIDFARAFEKHQNDLFAGNVRYAIKGANSETIRAGIRRSLHERPKDFSCFHNGITIVCKKLKYSSGKLEVVSPSIVNGAQTVTYVGDILGTNVPKSAEVLAKVVEVPEVDGFEEYETDIAISSNTQNRVSLSDLSVIDPDLVSIERYFRSQRCFLERKKGDKPLGRVELRTNKDRMLQLFASVDRIVGPSATKDKQGLYKNHANRLFEHYGRTLSSKKNALFLARLDKFVQWSIAVRYKTASGKKKRNRLSLSYYTIFATTVNLIKKLGLWSKMRSSFHADGIWDNEYADFLAKDVRKIAQSTLSVSKQDNEKNETSFFKNRDKVQHCMSVVEKKLARSMQIRRV